MKAKIAAVVCRLLGIQPAAPLTDRQIETPKTSGNQQQRVLEPSRPRDQSYAGMV